MRAPDREGTLSRDAPALAWVKAPRLAAEALGTLVGAPPEAMLALAQARDPLGDDDLAVRCWRMRKVVTRPDQEAGIATWVINGPFHPLWRWWALGVVHLRPLAGVRPVVLRREGASHEVLIFSVDPEKCPEPDIDKLEREGGELPNLMPLDLVHQVVGLDDEQAAELAGLMVKAIVAGEMSPDQDFAEMWRRTLDTTAEHLRSGGHPAG